MKTVSSAMLLLLTLSAAPAPAQTPAQIQQALGLLQQAEALLQAPVPVPAPSGRITTLAAGGDLQAALNTAQPGDTVRLTAGATYTGNFVLPAKVGSGVITVTTTATLPAGRIGPGDAALFPKLKAAPGGQPSLRTAPGAHDYALIGLEGLPLVGGVNDIWDLGDGSAAQTTLALVPHDLLVDRCYLHGDPVAGQKRGLGLNSAATTVMNSYISGIAVVGQDSQAIGGWNGPGPYLIANNYLEAAGENILFGGADPAVPNLIPSDITITGNYVTKPVAWHTASSKWQVKNLLELKSARRVTITGNVFENCWVQAQIGTPILLTVRDQDGTAPWSTVSDVTFSGNVVRHAPAGINVLGRDNQGPPAVGSVRAANIRILNNLFYDIDPKKWNDPVSGGWGTGRMLQVQEGPSGWEIGHNTMVYSTPNASPTINSAFTLGAIGDTFKTAGLNVHDNVFAEGDYGVIGDSVGIGAVALATYAPGYVFTDNLLIRGASGGNYPYPPTTTVNASGVAVVDPVTFKLLPAFAALPSTDGRPIGVDLDALRVAIPGLDLAK